MMKGKILLLIAVFLFQTASAVAQETGNARRTGIILLPFENGCKSAVKVKKCALDEKGALLKMAESTGLEPATSDVTG